jgi:pimeloyl-ACP methyl ester carboxylesterase
MHGFSFDSRMWRSQLDFFARRHRVLAYDARGFGRSAPADDPTRSPSDDLHAVLLRTDTERCILVAHSMAAITACDYSTIRPERIRALVLVSPSVANYHWPADFMAQWLAYQDLAAIDMAAAKTAWLGSELFRCACADPVVGQELRAMVDSYSGQHWLARKAVNSGKLGISDLDQIQQPVLLFSGSEDSAAFLQCASTLAEQLPDCRYIVLDRADHMCNMEQPAVFNRELEAFIATLAAD